MIKTIIAASLLLVGCGVEEQNAGNPLSLYTFDCGSIEISNLDAFSSNGDYAGLSGKIRV